MNRDDFLATARLSLDLAAQDAVAVAWDADSACEGMTVGGLTHHLLKQIHNTRVVLEAAPADAPTVGAHEHYERAAWVAAPLDQPVNARVRESSDADAAPGHAAVLAWARESYDAMANLMGEPRTPDVVAPPWLDYPLTTDDYLTTRLVELTVHRDDLAASVGLPTPEFPADVTVDVLGVLARIAVRRHGQTAVLRALSRPQRSDAPISAF